MWKPMMNALGCNRPDVELQWLKIPCEWSWWECALPADEEGNYRLDEWSARCVRTHKITADGRLSQFKRMISNRVFFRLCEGEESTLFWGWKTETSYEQIRIRHPIVWFALRRRFSTLAHLLTCSPSNQQRTDKPTATSIQSIYPPQCHISVTASLDVVVTRKSLLFLSRTMVSSLFILMPTRAHFRENLLCPWGFSSHCRYQILSRVDFFFTLPLFVGLSLR